jgi:hypothetical protein
MPEITKKSALVIRGISGDGADTAGIWERFINEYNAKPFVQSDGSGYELRVYSADACLCHVGYAVSDGSATEPFYDFVLPEGFYASFDVTVVNGYDSENANMEAWLSSNPDGWVQSELDGKSYVVECYSGRFETEGVVEIWIPIHKKA